MLITESALKRVIREELKSLMSESSVAGIGSGGIASELKNAYDIDVPFELGDDALEELVGFIEEEIQDRAPALLDSPLDSSKALGTKISSAIDYGGTAIGASLFIAALASGNPEAAAEIAGNNAVEAAQDAAMAKLGWGGTLWIALAASVPLAALAELDKTLDPYKRIIKTYEMQGNKTVDFGQGIVKPTKQTSQASAGAMQNPVYGMLLHTIENGPAKLKTMLDDGYIGDGIYEWIISKRRKAQDALGIQKRVKTKALALKKGASGMPEEMIRKINGFFGRVDNSTPGGSKMTRGMVQKVKKDIHALRADADRLKVDPNKVRAIVDQKVDDAGWGKGTGNLRSGLGGYLRHRADIDKVGLESAFQSAHRQWREQFPKK